MAGILREVAMRRLRRAAGMRDVLFHHSGRCVAASIGAVFPALARRPDRDHSAHQGHGGQVQITLATLSEVLRPALRGRYAVAGILRAGPGCRAHTPLPVPGAVMWSLRADVDLPVVAHLDHGYMFDNCRTGVWRAHFLRRRDRDGFVDGILRGPARCGDRRPRPVRPGADSVRHP